MKTPVNSRNTITNYNWGKAFFDSKQLSLIDYIWSLLVLLGSPEKDHAIPDFKEVLSHMNNLPRSVLPFCSAKRKSTRLPGLGMDNCPSSAALVEIEQH